GGRRGRHRQGADLLILGAAARGAALFAPPLTSRPRSGTVSAVSRSMASPVSPAAIGAAWSRGRLMGALFAAQVCGSAGHSIGMAVGGITAAEITGTNAWTGIPVAVGALGTALASWPLARLMARFGRRPGLALGYGLAVAGAGLAMSGVLARQFPLLLIG